MQSAPKNSSCGFYVLTMWVKYAATICYRIIVMFYVFQQEQQQQQQHRKNVLMLLEDTVLREKFE